MYTLCYINLWGGISISAKKLVHQQLIDFAKNNGFLVKRNCCYRIINNDIMQLLKFEYEPRFRCHELRMGLYSLYSELDPRWLTDSGCILRYPVHGLIQQYNNDELSIDMQLLLLNQLGLKWLNSIRTQKDLVNALCNFERHYYGKIHWVDSFKLAPFLASNDYTAADQVISSILQQHVGPNYWTTEPWNANDFERYKLYYPGEDLRLLEIHEWIESEDFDSITKYLNSNLSNNTGVLSRVLFSK